MANIKVTRPDIPKGYVDKPKSEVPWAEVEKRLVESKNYWMCSVRPDGRPHAIPRWAVYLDEKIYYDGSPQTRHARNLVENPNVSVHLESGQEAVILEGTAFPVSEPDANLAQRLAAAYRMKYEADGYAPEPEQWNEGGLYVFTPRQCIAWTVFFENPTKFIFEPEAS
jgi:nitroimidazol reductase NimA-like FMN-containing flavoprotein (pyridoxamine 5'-phosphate oxidase superfamily)